MDESIVSGSEVANDVAVDNAVEDAVGVDTDVGSVDADPEVDVWDEEFDMDDAPIDDADDAEVVPDDVEAPVNMKELYKAQNDAADGKLDKPIYIKFKGKVIDVESIAELKDLAERGLGANKKYLDMAEDRKTIQFMYENNIDMETLNSVIASRGEKPVESDASNINPEVLSIATEIEASSYAGEFTELVSKLPQVFHEQMRVEPGLLKGLSLDVENGILTQGAIDKMDRLIAINGMDPIEAYLTATDEAPEVAKQKNDELAEKRNTLQSQPTNNQISKQPTSAWDMSDDEYDRYFAKM